MKHSLLLYLAIPAFVLTLVSCSKDSPDYGDEVIIEGDYRKLFLARRRRRRSRSRHGSRKASLRT